MAKKNYKYTGLHAHVLPSGRPIAPGEEVELDDVDSSGLMADGLLLDLDDNTMQTDVTDAALKLAKKEGVRLENIRGSGKDGTITVEDVQAAADAAKGTREEE